MSINQSQEYYMILPSAECSKAQAKMNNKSKNKRNRKKKKEKKEWQQQQQQKKAATVAAAEAAQFSDWHQTSNQPTRQTRKEKTKKPTSKGNIKKNTTLQYLETKLQKCNACYFVDSREIGGSSGLSIVNLKGDINVKVDPCTWW